KRTAPVADIRSGPPTPVVKGPVAPAVPVLKRGPWQAWQAFWFTPASPVALHAVRVVTGLLLIGWLLPFAGQVDAMFGLQGWFARGAYLRASPLPQGSPVPLDWSILYMAGNSSAMLHALYWGALVVFALFTLGLATRITSVLTWVLVVSFLANPAARF